MNYRKSILSITLALISPIMLMANLNGNGFYRIKNYGTNRWAYMVDNKAKTDVLAGQVELHSLQLSSNTEFILSEPGSIIYINNVSGLEYNMAAQGSSVAQVAGYPVKIGTDGSSGDQTLYRIYGVYKGATEYIGDKKPASGGVDGNATTSKLSDPKRMQWLIYPVASNSDNYFGVVPNLTVGGKMYNLLYTSFSYQPVSPDVKIYYIARATKGMAEMIEVNGPVPAGVPVIIECAGSSAADNKMNLLVNQASLPSNALTGVYFDWNNAGFVNEVEYDPSTMRVLGQCSDGSLGFITDYSLSTIPANSGYLRVESGSPAEYKCVDSAVFTAGIDSVATDGISLRFSAGVVYCGEPANISVVNLAGQTVASAYGDSIDISHLQKGVYIAMAGTQRIKVMVN